MFLTITVPNAPPINPIHRHGSLAMTKEFIRSSHRAVIDSPVGEGLTLTP